MTSKEAIQDRKVYRGDRFVAKYKGRRYVVTALDDGQYRVVSPRGEVPGKFASLSAVGRTITGTATNGWRFFRREAPQPLTRRTA